MSWHGNQDFGAGYPLERMTDAGRYLLDHRSTPASRVSVVRENTSSASGQVVQTTVPMCPLHANAIQIHVLKFFAYGYPRVYHTQMGIPEFSWNFRVVNTEVCLLSTSVLLQISAAIHYLFFRNAETSIKNNHGHLAKLAKN